MYFYYSISTCIICQLCNCCQINTYNYKPHQWCNTKNILIICQCSTVLVPPNLLFHFIFDIIHIRLEVMVILSKYQYTLSELKGNYKFDRPCQINLFRFKLCVTNLVIKALLDFYFTIPATSNTQNNSLTKNHKYKIKRNLARI